MRASAARCCPPPTCCRWRTATRCAWSPPNHAIAPISQNANIPWFREQEQQALWIHPRDAAARKIANGQVVEVSSPQGRVRIAARVTEDIMPGVVCLLEGVWPTFAADGTDTAGSPNVLTSTVPTEPSQASRTALGARAGGGCIE